MQKTHLQVAEEYVFWAARHKVSQETVCRVLFQRWIHFHLDEEEQQWIRTLAQTLCDSAADLDAINAAWKDIGRTSEPQPIRRTAQEIILWLKKLRNND